jgi:hypothetical protein
MGRTTLDQQGRLSLESITLAAACLLVVAGGYVILTHRRPAAPGQTGSSTSHPAAKTSPAPIAAADTSATTKPAVKPVNQTISYKNDHLGFSFRYPANWGEPKLQFDDAQHFLLAFPEAKVSLAAQSKAYQNGSPNAQPDRGYVEIEGTYYERNDGAHDRDITAQVKDTLDTAAGKVVIFLDDSALDSDPQLVGLVNLKQDPAFPGLNVHYERGTSAADLAALKAVMASFSYQ